MISQHYDYQITQLQIQEIVAAVCVFVFVCVIIITRPGWQNRYWHWFCHCLVVCW